MRTSAQNSIRLIQIWFDNLSAGSCTQLNIFPNVTQTWTHPHKNVFLISPSVSFFSVQTSMNWSFCAMVWSILAWLILWTSESRPTLDTDHLF